MRSGSRESVSHRGQEVACAGEWIKRGEEGRGGVCSGENKRDEQQRLVD